MRLNIRQKQNEIMDFEENIISSFHNILNLVIKTRFEINTDINLSFLK